MFHGTTSEATHTTSSQKIAVKMFPSYFSLINFSHRHQHAYGHFHATDMDYIAVMASRYAVHKYMYDPYHPFTRLTVNYIEASFATS
jgi:hypothetical protein